MSNTLLTSVAAAALLLAAGARAEVFLDVGLHGTHVEADVATFTRVTTTESGLHLGLGVRRELASGSIGARAELDDIDGDLLLAVRALDYRRHLTQRFAVTAFLGAARLDLATPAYGYYLGAGVQLKELWPSWSLALDVRYGDKIARDNLLPSDPQGGKNDNFYDLSGIAVYLSRRF
jgi:opacity protein-like surface antigen